MAETTFHSITLPGANPARVPLTAVEFSTSTTYKVRDYCTYQGKLYICSTAHAAGAWNAAHFTEVNVGDEINTRLIVPPTTEPASTDRRVGDLWIDTNTESPVISVDPQPVAGSTNVPQSGGTFNLIKNLDDNKASKSLLTGEFSTSSPYSVNDLCIHDGYLYRCIVDIPTGAAWNSSKWQATTIETELARIESEEVDLDVIAETFGDSNSYAVGDYVLHTENGVDKLYRCTSAVSDTSVWNSQYWSEVKLADEVSDLKNALTSVRDIFIREMLVEEHPITRPSSQYGSATFNGYAFPLKDIANIRKIVFNGLASASATLNVGIATSIVSNVTQISYLSTGTASIGTSRAFTEITMPTYTAKGPGYIVIYADQTISSIDNSAKYDSDIIDNSMTAYYIEGQTAKTIAAENFMKWSPYIYFYRDVETVDQTMIHKMNHIYVATTGSDDNGDGTSGNPFATIYHANSIIHDNSARNEYTIHVADGTYTDLQTRYSNAPQSSGYQGIVAKNHVYYIGNEVHPENVVIQWDGSTGYSSDVFNYYDYGFYKCPFHVVGSDNGGGKTAIKGMTFVCSNTRYCLHVDTSGYGKGVDWVVENCIFDWKGTPDCTDKTSTTPTIGDGSSNYEIGLVKNCLFKNVSGQTDAFVNHDCENRYGNDALKVGADITFENCKFNGGAEQSLRIRMRNLLANSNYDLFNRVQIINCIGITTFNYGVSSPATSCNWRALVRCSPIETNKFAQDGLMQ